MLDSLIDALIDTLKLSPYLFITFLILELIEHKLNKKSKKILSNNKKYGPILGGILGGLPQCGFSSMAANLFSGRVITIGTLIAVFLSTSDEMLPIMIGEHANIWLLIRIIGFKIIIGIVIGLIIDIVLKKPEKDITIKELCDHEHCGCKEHSIVVSSLIHTLKTIIFVFIANLIINILILKIGEESLSNLLLHHNIITYFVASLIGLIPNCAGSVIITELYLAKLITIGNLLSGLLTGSGLGILLLFKSNKNIKENFFITLVIYLVGVLVGIIVDLVI